MQCDYCNCNQSDSNKYCANCGKPLSTASVLQNAVHPSKKVLYIFVACCLCLLWALYVALFTAFWNLPAFDGPSDPPEFYSELKSGYQDLKEAYEDDRPFLSNTERVKYSDFLNDLEKVANHPSIVTFLRFVDKNSYQIEDSAKINEALQGHLLFIALLFVASTVIFIIILNAIRKNKKVKLELFVIPGVFCYYYNGILAVIVMALLAILLTTAQGKHLTLITKGSP